MSKILSLTAVALVAGGFMLAMPAQSQAAVPVGVSVGVGPVVGSFSTYPAAPYAVYAPPAPVVVAPAFPAPVVVRPYPYYRGYGYRHYGHYGHHHHGWHR